MNTYSRYQAAPGFTLLEVLIAIVVVAFGLLGLAGLQVFALKNNQSASLRVAATNLTADIIDRMKANYIGVINDEYNRPLKPSDPPEPTEPCSDGCSPAAIARNDLLEWQQRVAATLPGGVGIVCLDQTPNETNALPDDSKCDGAGTTNYAVKIWWYDDRTKLDKDNRVPRKYMYTAFNP